MSNPATSSGQGLAAGVYTVSPAALMEKAAALSDAYAKAEPFPHAVIDGLFPEPVLNALLEEFPDPGGLDWKQFDNPNEKKLASKTELQLPNAAREFIWQLNSQAFMHFLETLTGIPGLIPDPHLFGGGLHQIVPGGMLKVHADFNRQPHLKLDRRINLLVYLNRDWKEEYGGHLQLWDREMKACVKKILPLFNRCVVFSTTDFSYHGHPDPLTCPEGWRRRSVAMYYYSNGRPAEELSGAHTTLFQARPGETIAPPPPKRGAKDVLKDFLPPILVRGVRRLLGRKSP